MKNIQIITNGKPSFAELSKCECKVFCSLLLEKILDCRTDENTNKKS